MDAGTRDGMLKAFRAPVVKCRYSTVRERTVMSRVEEIEEHVRGLRPEELAAFREWFAAFDAEAWDREFEADAIAGRLDDVAERALRDHAAGRSTKL